MYLYAIFLLSLNGILACNYHGKEFKVGEKFKSADGCNDCVCGAIGVVCTKMLCKNDADAPCKVTQKDGTVSVYKNGEVYKAADGCNTCKCSNGFGMCTLMMCTQDMGCIDSTGKSHGKGENYKAADGCNMCTCLDGGSVCTDMACTKGTANDTSDTGACTYKPTGVSYKDGDKFKDADGCNTCFCQNGAISCTEMACVPKDNQCFDKYTFQVYNEGEKFQAADGCNTCVCKDGQIGCTKIFCGPLDNKE